MPGGQVLLVSIIGKRGSGKSEYGIKEYFLTSPSGILLDMGVASESFKYAKDNRLQISIPKAQTLRDAIFYMKQNKISHFSFHPQSQEEASFFISQFSKFAYGKTLMIDDAQKLLSYYDSNSEYKDFLSDGRMMQQNLILCFHKIGEVSTKTRSESDVIIFMGPLTRRADIEGLYNEWEPQNMDDMPNMDVLYREMVKTPQFRPYFIKGHKS